MALNAKSMTSHDAAFEPRTPDTSACRYMRAHPTHPAI